MSDKYLQRASGFYLCESLPSNWQDLSDDEVDNFLRENVWVPFENWPISEVLDEMSNLAADFQRLEDELLTT
jgi:hypothetical protein